MNTKIPIPNWVSTVFRQLTPNIGSILIMAAMLFVYDAHAAGLAAGASPSTISYQGTLSTAGGTPVNANIGLTFRLYNIQSGGTALWTEAHPSVPVNSGLFHVQLGSITPIPSSVWDNTTVYLGVQVGGDSAELSPREVVSAVPFAMNIQIPDGSITSTKLADRAVTSDKMAMTYWNIENYSISDPNGYWTTTTSAAPVEVPLSFSFTPPKDGVIFLNLSMTFRHSSTSGSNLYCDIVVNDVNDTNNHIARGIQFVSSSNMENCATNIAYPVSAGQTYRFFAGTYSTQSGTTTVRLKSFSHLTGFYVVGP